MGLGYAEVYCGNFPSLRSGKCSLASLVHFRWNGNLLVRADNYRLLLVAGLFLTKQKSLAKRFKNEF